MYKYCDEIFCLSSPENRDGLVQRLREGGYNDVADTIAADRDHYVRIYGFHRSEGGLYDLFNNYSVPANTPLYNYNKGLQCSLRMLDEE